MKASVGRKGSREFARDERVVSVIHCKYCTEKIPFEALVSLVILVLAILNKGTKLSNLVLLRTSISHMFRGWRALEKRRNF